MGDWTFLTNHARALLFIAREPDARLRDLADGLEITERTAYGIVADLAEAGYVVKEKEGRRNRYHIQPDRPLRERISRERTIGEVLELLGAERRSGHEQAEGWSIADDRRSPRSRTRRGDPRSTNTSP